MLITCHVCHKLIDSPDNSVITISAELTKITLPHTTTYPLAETVLVCGACAAGRIVWNIVPIQPVDDTS